MSFWVCLIIGIALGFIVTAIMKSQLKSVHFQSGAASYLEDSGLTLRLRTDRFLYENTVRTPRPQNNKK